MIMIVTINDVNKQNYDTSDNDNDGERNVMIS